MMSRRTNRVVSAQVPPRTRSITPTVGIESGFGPDQSFGGFVGEVQAELAVELSFVVWRGFDEYYFSRCDHWNDHCRR
jgi:hypothetical protein